MDSETQHYLQLLERRIDLLGALAETLKASSADVVALDIDNLQSRIAKQERLCVDIHALDPQLDRVQRQCAAHLRSGEVNPTIQRLQDLQASVKALNNTHQALLRRSRRTVGALLNSYHSFATTYSDPARAAAEERL